MMPRAPVVLVASLAACLTACLAPAVPSKSLSTSSMRAFYKVEVSSVSTPPSTTLYASYYSGASTVTLGEGDVVAASTDKDQNVALEPSMGLYTARLPVLDRTAFTITLTRAGGQASKSTITLGPLMAITSPTPKQTLSYASGNAVITWSSPTPGARVHAFAGPCNGIQISDTPEVDDTGTYTLPMAKVLLGGKPAAPQCTKLYVIRKTKGSVDPGLGAGSTFESNSTVAVEVTVGP